MPTVHEILANAPKVREQIVNFESLRYWWSSAKSFEIKTAPIGLSIDASVVASLLWRVGEVRSFALPDVGDRERFIELVKGAQARLAQIGRANPKVAGIHSHIINNWG